MFALCLSQVFSFLFSVILFCIYFVYPLVCTPPPPQMPFFLFFPLGIIVQLSILSCIQFSKLHVPSDIVNLKYCHSYCHPLDIAIHIVIYLIYLLNIIIHQLLSLILSTTKYCQLYCHPPLSPIL